jgi:hypothetical protein
MSQVETPKVEGETPKVEGTTETPVVKPAAEGEKPKADGQQPTGDAAKAGDATVKEGAANADGSAKPDGEKPKAPDTYTLTAPDGMDAEELKAFETFARERGLSNEQAAAALEALPDALASQVSRFRADVEKHPEVGGDKLQAAQANALKALDHFLPADTPEGKALRRGLDVSGYGNYAPLVVLLARIGKAMGEDGGVGSVKAASKTGGEKKDAATLLYGDTAPKS